MLEKCVVGENETARGKEEKLRILIWRQHVIGEPYMVSDTIKIPMNNTMKRLEMLLKGHPKMSEDTMTRFRKVRRNSLDLSP